MPSVSSQAIPNTSRKPPIAAWEASHRFSIDQYHGMIEQGILQKDERVELIEGVIFDMSPIGKRHRTVVTHAAELLMEKLPSGWHIMVQQPITLGNSEPEPDLAVVRGKSLDYRDRDIVASDLGLVIEVADISLARDRSVKIPLYASCGIKMFWLVNLVDDCVEVYSVALPATDSTTASFSSNQVVSQNDRLDLILDGRLCANWHASEFLP